MRRRPSQAYLAVLAGLVTHVVERQKLQLFSRPAEAHSIGSGTAMSLCYTNGTALLHLLYWEKTQPI